MGRMTLLYGALGPLIGALCLVPFWYALFNHLWPYPAEDVEQVIKRCIVIIFDAAYISYVLGLTPALTTGVLVGLLPRRWRTVWFVSCAGLIGSLVTTGWFLEMRSFDDLGLMPLLGGFSAGTLALTLRCTPRPHPNRSA